jgi:hypothetical protein
MSAAMPQLHPLIPPGPLDLAILLSHEPPTRWRPEPGEVVTGILIKLEDKVAFGRTAPTLYLLLEDGRYATVRASGVVLRGGLDTLKPRTGEKVAVKFEGMRTSNEGRNYALHRIAVRRTGGWQTSS